MCHGVLPYRLVWYPKEAGASERSFCSNSKRCCSLEGIGGVSPDALEMTAAPGAICSTAWDRVVTIALASEGPIRCCRRRVSVFASQTPTIIFRFGNGFRRRLQSDFAGITAPGGNAE